MALLRPKHLMCSKLSVAFGKTKNATVKPEVLSSLSSVEVSLVYS